jgi:hypothetical protein
VFDTGDKVVARENGNSARWKALHLAHGGSAFLGKIPPALDHPDSIIPTKRHAPPGGATAQSHFGMTLAALITGVIFDHTAVQNIITFEHADFCLA